MDKQDQLQSAVLLQEKMGQQTMTQQSEKKRRRQDSTAATANLIRGLDHGLREMGLSLKHFQRTEGAPFSAVLQAGEVRYMVKCQEPWGDFEIPAAAPWQRSAVKDVTWQEAVRGPELVAREQAQRAGLVWRRGLHEPVRFSPAFLRCSREMRLPAGQRASVLERCKKCPV